MAKYSVECVNGKLIETLIFMGEEFKSQLDAKTSSCFSRLKDEVFERFHSLPEKVEKAIREMDEFDEKELAQLLFILEEYETAAAYKTGDVVTIKYNFISREGTILRGSNIKILEIEDNGKYTIQDLCTGAILRNVLLKKDEK